jgi:thioredoxin 1
MTALLDVTGLNFVQEVLKSDLPVLIDVSADWCPPCKAAAPVIHELAERHAGRLKVVMVDGNQSTDLVAALGVRGFPTFIGVVRGEVVVRQAGFGGRRGLEQLVNELLAESPTPQVSANA